MNKSIETFDLLGLNEEKIEPGEFRIKLVTDLYISNDEDLIKNHLDFDDENSSESLIDWISECYNSDNSKSVVSINDDINK